MSLTALSQGGPQTLKEYEIELLKRKTKNGIQTSLELGEDCEADWLPRINNPLNIKPAQAGLCQERNY